MSLYAVGRISKVWNGVLRRRLTLPRSPDQPLNGIPLIVNHEDNRLALILNHRPYLLNRKRHTSISRAQNRPALAPARLKFPTRNVNAQRRCRCEANTAVVDLRHELHVCGKGDVAESPIGGAGFANKDVAGTEECFD